VIVPHSTPRNSPDKLTAKRPPASVAAASTGPAEGNAARLVEEMLAAWERGERTPAEAYLALDPELGEDTEAALQLIYEEVCLRRGEGEEVPLSELVRRFPRWHAELEVLLECDRLLESGPPAPVLPAVGESLGDFQLLAELGRGTRGRCFLAAQPALADRLVVLKVTPNDHSEHLSLACLQHTHIVPLYSEQEFRERHLRAICMPYLGGATLGQVLAFLDELPLSRRTGQSLLDALARTRTIRPAAAGASPAETFLARTSYFRAICWVGACLADALQYAHDRGLVHMDVKPSNVLLAADGQPLLLDFHLARSPLDAGAAAPEWLGGTPGYMSPEQEAAVAAVSEGRAIPTAVGERSDVYSLGLTLCQALDGTVTLGPRGAAVRFPREVSTSLGDLIRKCLAYDPYDRYPDAATLADDLRRHMADLPLQGVANRNLSERWFKWCRRRPAAVVRLKTLFFVTAAAAAVGAAVWAAFIAPRVHAAEQALKDGKVLLSQRDYSEAARVLARGVALIEGLPGFHTLSQGLAGQARQASVARDADLLHDLVERLRFFESAVPRTVQEMKAAERQSQTLWETRRAILDQLGGALNTEAKARLRSDMLDLAVIGASLRVRLATGAGDGTRARREALRMLDEAEARFGPSHLMFRERLAHAQALGLTDAADAAARGASLVPPRTAGEHYAVGRSLLASGDLAGAEVAFDRALALRPQDFWSNFMRGVCASRRHHYEDAVNAFRVCIALAPDRAEPFYNRALAHAALGHADQASLDYDRAAELDPTLVDPHFNRGIPIKPTTR
jgi:serine/threonine protein kinase/Flp pilus assembly protein TadD